MGLDSWLKIAIGIIITIVGWAFVSNIMDVKKAIEDLKKDFGDKIGILTNDMKAREDRNFVEHNKIYDKISHSENEIVDLKSVQNHCKTCTGR